MAGTNYKDAQRAILSIIFNFGVEAMEIADKYLEERHFTEISYRMIWRCIKWLLDNGHEINEITAENSMLVTRDSTGQTMFDLLDPKSGRHREELLAIKSFRTGEAVSFLNSYMDLILDKFKVEKYLDLASQIFQKANDGRATAGQLQAIVNSYSPFFSEKDRKQPRSLVDIAETLIEKNKSSEDGDQSVIHTDIPMLQNFIWLTQGNQTVIAGDTGHGKTSLALQIAWNVAKQRKKIINPDTGKPELDDDGKEVWVHRRVLFFSLEMMESELLTKLCCIENNITMQKFMVELTPLEKISMLNSFKQKVSLIAPNFLVDYNVDSIKDVGNKCNMVHSTYGGLDLVVVDYLQLLAETKDKGMREDETYRAISRFFKKHIAMKLETHTIVLSQLNQPKQDKTGAVIHKPTLERLFGSSAMKQDATHVIFVYREWSVGIKTTMYGSESISSLYVNRVLLAKHRFGHNQVEILCGFVPYLSYFIPISRIKESNLLQSKDPTIVFPKIKEFMDVS